MKFWNWTRNLFAATALACGAWCWVITSPAHLLAEEEAADKKEAPAETEAADEEEAPADPFAVPDDASVAELLEFINRIEAMKPTKPREAAQLRQKKPAALQKAAEKILELESDKSSAAYVKAFGIAAQSKLAGLRAATPEKRNEFLAEFKAFVAGKEQLSTDDANLMRQIAVTFDMAGDSETAALAYSEFSALLAKSDDPKIAEMVPAMEGGARRATLVGNEMELTGTTLAGEEFDWTAYRGKVVLVDFWATWCGPCVAEHPNIRKMHEAYKDKGFDVVAISLDDKREALDKFLDKHPVEWTTLHEEGVGFKHPASVHYGIAYIPMMILVDQDGKVVSTRVRGAELKRLLQELLGDPAVAEEAEAEPADEAAANPAGDSK